MNRPTYESKWLHSDRWDELLTIGPDGTVPLEITFAHGALRERSTGLLVNVANRRLRRMGIWSARVRGDRYQTGGEVFVGPAELVREPDNRFDPHAVAVHSRARKIGYFNKQMAPALAALLDAGQSLDAYLISASPPKIIAAAPEVMIRLLPQRS